MSSPSQIDAQPETDISSLDGLFRPRSVAVVGASRRPGSIGAQIMANLLRAGFTGPVYPVNPTAHSVQAVRAFPSLGAITDDVDLAIIVVPRDHVLPAVREADRDTLIVADGTSCRQQIRDGAQREALHLARVLEQALLKS